MSIIAIVIGLYILFSATILVSICMISSRFSQQEGLVEEWTAQEWAYDEAPAPQKLGEATRYA